ncbi:MAG: MaoC family dehydratase [Bdellovibrionaceae bacterium]|nr:MaoC family dehydratase [Pseudobdellovibrionaceae bacterium]
MSFQVGDTRSVTVEITEKMVQQFAEMSGDFNPVHMDEAYAKTTRFGRRIAHGMISGALISRTLAMELGPGGIYMSQNLKFMQPIFIGDTVTVELKVLSIRAERGFCSIETLVKKQPSAEVCVKGEAMIMMPEFV